MDLRRGSNHDRADGRKMASAGAPFGDWDVGPNGGGGEEVARLQARRRSGGTSCRSWRVEGTLLDVGCGAKPFRGLVPSHVRYVGIDTTDAKGHFGYAAPDVMHYSGDTWPVETGQMDTILCTETLEHVLDVDRFLSEAARCLRTGGLLFMTIPFSARWHFVPTWLLAVRTVFAAISLGQGGIRAHRGLRSGATP